MKNENKMTIEEAVRVLKVSNASWYFIYCWK
jgi:hypothetical protein